MDRQQYCRILLFSCFLCGTVTCTRLVEKPLTLLNTTDLSSTNYTPRHIAGYFKLDRTYDASMFYFFFEQREKPQKDSPLILWMTGGPGCSSELAVFYENGPFHIKKDLTLTPNPYGWDNAGSIIFVDQPINTGFSFSEDERDRVYDEKTVSADMLDFLLTFLDAHPEFKGKDFYVTGESYAGHYVPAVSYTIHKYNKAANSTDINLKGLAIGNGLTDPAIQYGAYADFALLNNLVPKPVHDAMKLVYPVCKFGINTCNALDNSFICRAALQFCTISQFSSVLAVAGNINVYDIRKPCEGPLCYDFSRLDAYINQPHVRKELGVGDRKWEACNMEVNLDMQGDWMKNYDDIIPPMLEDGLRVMIYAGVQDLICNWLGNERWLDALSWSNASHFQAAHPKTWTVNETRAGSVRSAGGLQFVKVEGAGHMVPMDQSASALDMIAHFVYNLPLTTTTQEKIVNVGKVINPHGSSLARPLRIGMAGEETSQTTFLTLAS